MFLFQVLVFFLSAIIVSMTMPQAAMMETSVGYSVIPLGSFWFLDRPSQTNWKHFFPRAAAVSLGGTKQHFYSSIVKQKS